MGQNSLRQSKIVSKYDPHGDQMSSVDARRCIFETNDASGCRACDPKGTVISSTIAFGGHFGVHFGTLAGRKQHPKGGIVPSVF